MTVEQRGSPLDPDEMECAEHGELGDGEVWIDGEGLWWCTLCLVQVDDETGEATS